MKEEFRDIKGYEGYYQISNLGRVKSLSRKVKFLDKPNYIKKERILKNTLDNVGYYSLGLKLNLTTKTIRLHRLIAETFIPNPENKPCVNHKDGNKLNNNIKNLEWVTYKENLHHAYDIGLNRWERCVIQISLDGFILNEFKSHRQAYKETGVHYKMISNCINGKSKQAGGYIWQ